MIYYITGYTGSITVDSFIYFLLTVNYTFLYRRGSSIDWSLSLVLEAEVRLPQDISRPPVYQPAPSVNIQTFIFLQESNEQKAS